MTGPFKVACIQNSATPDLAADIATCLRLIARAAGEGAKLIALPEYCVGLDTREGRLYPVAFPEHEHPAIPAFAAAALKHGADILIGSIGVRSSDRRIFNRSVLLDAKGEVRARYDKIHMFDVDLAEDKVYRESATIAPGELGVIADCLGTKIGLSICYDLRFADLYRAYAQAGAEMLAIPAAFTRLTGEAHWHVLNRARAIENLSFVIAPCQYGTLSGGAECFGHSLIVDPWGRILADGGENEGVIVADVDLAHVAASRSRIPSLQHDRPFGLGGAQLAAE
jgi:deaminated glutathione amidase